MAGRVLGRCNRETPYTGSNGCTKGEALTAALLFHDVKARYTDDEDAFITDLPTLVYATDLTRIYPVGNIQAVDISGFDTNTSDNGSGYTVPTNKSQVIATYTLPNDDCLYKQLLKMQHVDWRVFRVDQDGYIYGTIIKDEFCGFRCQVAVRRIQASGTDSAYLYLEVYYSAQYEAELSNLNAYQIGVENIPEGLVPVIVQTVGGGSKVIGECSAEDYTEQYGGQWTAPMFIQSSGTAATSVAYADGVLTITPSGTYRVADASVLAPAGILGITGIPLT